MCGAAAGANSANRHSSTNLRLPIYSMKDKPTVLKDSGQSKPMENVSLAPPRAGERPMPMPWSRPMASFASCFARPHHAARGLGSQAVRQPRLRAVVASSVLDAPSRQHGCRGPRAPRGVWASCMRTATECAPPPPRRSATSGAYPLVYFYLFLLIRCRTVSIHDI